VRKTDPVKHEKRRRRILEAAGRCFVRDGFSGASISDICSEAKISPGHLYHYFASKEAIVSAMTEARLAQVAARIEHSMQSADPILAFCAELDSLKAKRSHASLVFDMLAEAERNPGIAELLRERERALRPLLAASLAQAQERGQIDRSLDADLAGAVLLGLIDGAKAMMLRDPKLKNGGIEHMKILITRFLAPRG
jgi:TetR/AcrR family transcriptional regulator, repressor for uid operon